ncbi:MAG: NIPSNAP family protein, partial [Proteobacteria bacterium]|nr:NIPSNAP family protein [Pseudomonadota bacterium]
PGWAATTLLFSVYGLVFAGQGFYTDVAWPLFVRRGYDRSLVGYFTVDVGTLNQLIHLWRFAARSKNLILRSR